MRTATPMIPTNQPSTSDAPATQGRPVVAHDGDCVVIDIPMTFRKRNGRKLVVLPEGMRQPATAESDARCPLRLAMARAYRWQTMIESGEVRSAGDIARRLKLDRSFVARTLRLAALAPNIVEAVLRGDEPDGPSLKAMRFDIPLGWQEQHAMLGMAVSARCPASHHPARSSASSERESSATTSPTQSP